MSWYKARERGAMRFRPLAKPLEAILAGGTRNSVKRRLLFAGILENRCQQCGFTEWRGKALSIQIDHVNGVRDDNRLENVRMLCPNCHSQTETFAGYNRPRSRVV